MSGYTRFLEMLSIQPDITDAPGAVVLKQAKGDILFENVSFHYEDHSEMVLSGLNLHVSPGEYVALVGTSGVGKSTLCSLIPRFYDVSEGRILLDGTDIRNFTLKSLRENIGIVQQDVYLLQEASWIISATAVPMLLTQKLLPLPKTPMPMSLL